MHSMFRRIFNDQYPKKSIPLSSGSALSIISKLTKYIDFGLCQK